MRKASWKELREGIVRGDAAQAVPEHDASAAVMFLDDGGDT